MHCYERPTVALALEVPRERGTGDWEWVACEVTPPVEEYAYTGQEVCSLLRAYGALVADAANHADPQDYPHIRIRAYGLFTGRTMGTLEFRRSADTGRYEPQGDPLVIVPPLHTWPPEVIRGWAVMSGKTGGRPCGSCPYRDSESPSETRSRIAAARRSGEAARGRQAGA